MKVVFNTSASIGRRGRGRAASGRPPSAACSSRPPSPRRLPEVSSIEQGALWRETGDALLAAGEVREARRWIERSAELFDAACEPTGRASATVAAARCGVWAGSFGDHIDLRPVAAIAADEDLPASVRAEAQLVASELAWMSGDAAGSLRWSAQAVDRATAIDEPALAAEALVSSATGHWLQLGLVDALDDLDRAAELADAAGSDGATALVAGRRALTCWWLGRVDDAVDAAERGLAAADRANLPLERALPLAAPAAIAAMRGDREASIRATAEADLLCSLSGDHWAAAFIYPTAAANAVWQGDLDEAEAHLARWDESLDGVDHGRRHLVHVMIDATRRYLAVVGGDRSQADVVHLDGADADRRQRRRRQRRLGHVLRPDGRGRRSARAARRGGRRPPVPRRCAAPRPADHERLAGPPAPGRGRRRPARRRRERCVVRARERAGLRRRARARGRAGAGPPGAGPLPGGRRSRGRTRARRRPSTTPPPRWPGPDR